MVETLHKLTKDDLAIVVDATYSRLEKSANNQFQYRCWREQKKDLLTKPFLICFADGYIIDCYGPFQANYNDAKILQYILETDEDLKKLLEPEKTFVFLDRGFRDVCTTLKNNYKFNTKIPFCKQLKDLNNSLDNEDDSDENEKDSKQLTTMQSNESRLVTKCRFIVEKQFGNLKNKKSLDNIRNVQAGHIQIDYRIACAMINFDHKPCCPDGENAVQIANQIEKKTKKEFNSLEFLLSRQLDTKLISFTNLFEINDFPVFSQKKMMEKIFYGTFQLKQCKSYLNDLITNGRAYTVTQQLLKTISDKNIQSEFLASKIVAVEILSRHKRGEIKQKEVLDNNNQKLVKKYRNVYKVFVQYTPSINSSKSIKGYICSCKSGRKTVGCCVHVATLIFYLSYAKYHPIKLPGEHLNSIFIDIQKRELPNQPRYVRNKRNKTNQNISDLSGDLVDSDSTDSETAIIENTNIEFDQENAISNENSSTNTSNITKYRKSK